jgi:hypothetical protein
MNAQELWKRYEDWLYYHEGLDLYLDVSRMRFDDLCSGPPTQTGCFANAIGAITES